MIKHQCKNLTIIQIIAILSLVFLASAYFIQYFLNISPCKLCLYQRIPYFILVILGVLVSIKIGRKFSKNILLNLCRIVIVVEIFLAGYHVGIERGFIHEIVPCKVESLQVGVNENLRMQIEDAQPSCKDVGLRIAGLSLAEINLIAIFCLLMLSFYKRPE
ncbi:MAG: disulfide bond formation protein B [Rickettsiales bacterium]|nr:disulfide bond formation protein B [Rickettsiales bacterium]